MRDCKYCNKEFKGYNSSFYCSKNCYAQHRLEHALFKHSCKRCKKEFESKSKTTKFCSASCSSKFNNQGGNLVSLKSFIKTYGKEEGQIRYQQFVEKLSNSLKGREGPLKGKHLSKERKEQISKGVKNSEWHKNRKGKALSESKKEQISKKMKCWTYTLKWFVDKFGEEIGTQKHKERSKLISEKSHFRTYNKIHQNKNCYSKISQKLFWLIYNRLTILKNEKVYFAQLNHEYSCGISHCNYDFVTKNRKKIIEFNGDKFHANPKLYKPDDYPNPFIKKTSQEIWEFDNKKNKLAESKGYQILIIWESEFHNNEEEIVKKCIDFLEN